MTGDGYLDWLRRLAAEVPRRDRLGTARLIDQPARVRARDSVDLALPVSLGRPVVGTVDPDGSLDFSLETYSVPFPGSGLTFGFDRVEWRCHGVTNTHVDAINHALLDGTAYAGWAPDDPDLPSVADLAGAGLFTRGVFADIPSLLGRDWVPIDEPITGDHLDRAVSAAGVTFEPGDALLVDVGRDRFTAAGGDLESTDPGAGLGGLGRGAAEWIADNGVSILCWDWADSRRPAEPPVPVHSLIWALGLIIVDNCTFGGLQNATVGALVVAPPATRGSTGSFVNPLLVL
jgi:kynurenine formamidase